MSASRGRATDAPIRALRTQAMSVACSSRLAPRVSDASEQEHHDQDDDQDPDPRRHAFTSLCVGAGFTVPLSTRPSRRPTSRAPHHYDHRHDQSSATCRRAASTPGRKFRRPPRPSLDGQTGRVPSGRSRPRVTQRVAVEDDHHEPDPEQHDLVERPRDRQHAERREPSQGPRDPPVTSEDLHGPDETSAGRQHREESTSLELEDAQTADTAFGVRGSARLRGDSR